MGLLDRIIRAIFPDLTHVKAKTQEISDEIDELREEIQAAIKQRYEEGKNESGY